MNTKENYQDIFDFIINHEISSDKNYWIDLFKFDLEQLDCCERTALHYAAYDNDLELLSILIKKGAKIEAQDEFGLTPLHRAAYWNNIEAVQFLIESGADLTVTDNCGSTVLHQAVLGSALDVVRFLLTQKINTHVLNIDGLTPLELALSKNTKQCSFPFFALLDRNDCENVRASRFKKDFDKNSFNIQKIIDLLKIAA